MKLYIKVFIILFKLYIIIWMLMCYFFDECNFDNVEESWSK